MVVQMTNVSSRELSLAEQEAYTLSEAALMIDRARSTRDAGDLASALDHNLELWIGIRALISRRDSAITGQVRDNLVKLADYVAQTILDKGIKMAPQTLDSLININLQISEGLLEGHARH